MMVDRMDFSKSHADTKRIEAALEQERSVVIFPEGTFSYATGVRPFKSGAFKVATETGRRICPVAINGARKILRANSYLLRPAVIKITICEPLTPDGKEWEEMVRLRTTARTLIARYSGEQTIDLVLAGLPSR